MTDQPPSGAIGPTVTFTGQVWARRAMALRRRDCLMIACAFFAAFLLIAALGASYSAGSPFCGPGCLEDRFNRLTNTHDNLTMAETDQTRKLVQRELAFSPFDLSAWLRGAALEANVGDRLNAAATEDLLAAYRFDPVDAQFARWRLQFMFEHWDELTPALRLDLLAEVRGLMVSPANGQVLKDIEPHIGNRAGRLACELLSRPPA